MSNHITIQQLQFYVVYGDIACLACNILRSDMSYVICIAYRHTRVDNSLSLGGTIERSACEPCSVSNILEAFCQDRKKAVGGLQACPPLH